MRNNNNNNRLFMRAYCTLHRPRTKSHLLCAGSRELGRVLVSIAGIKRGVLPTILYVLDFAVGGYVVANISQTILPGRDSFET